MFNNEKPRPLWARLFLASAPAASPLFLIVDESLFRLTEFARLALARETHSPSVVPRVVSLMRPTC